MDNREKNSLLAELYEESKREFLAVWGKTFQEQGPDRLNLFGIVDEETYADILFIGKETNGWGNIYFEQDSLFLPWLRRVAQGQDRAKNMQIWYNVGRWAKYIMNANIHQQELITQKTCALKGLKYVAFTNVNKVRGYNRSNREYTELSQSDIAKKVLCREIHILDPKVIVLCGIEKKYLNGIVKDNTKVIEMPHPSARKSKKEMLELLEKQLNE